MHPTIRSLLILQDRDQQLDAISSEIAAIPIEQQNLHQQLAHNISILQRAESQLEEFEKKTAHHEAELATRVKTLERLRQQLSEVHKLQEIQVFENEIARYQQDIDAAEVTIFSEIERGETQREKLAKAREKMALLEKQTARQVDALEQKLAVLRVKWQEAQVARNLAAEPIPSSELALYDGLHRTKANPVSPVHHGQCNGCHMKLVASTYVKVLDDSTVTCCENCGRILYADLHT